MNKFSPIRWAFERMMERTTWDGVLLMAVGLSGLLFNSVVPFIVPLAIVYALWTIVLPEF